MDPDVVDALDWMTTTGRGYRAASKLYGVPIPVLRAARNVQRARAGARPGERTDIDDALAVLELAVDHGLLDEPAVERLDRIAARAVGAVGAR